MNWGPPIYKPLSLTTGPDVSCCFAYYYVEVLEYERWISSPSPPLFNKGAKALIHLEGLIELKKKHTVCKLTNKENITCPKYNMGLVLVQSGGYLLSFLHRRWQAVGSTSLIKKKKTFRKSERDQHATHSAGR